MGKFIVMDIVFYAGSLNYDQGSGNYQELKKITKWDGKQYTFVSRYALRYSLLETGRKLGLWGIAEGNELQRPGDNQQTVIQPAIDLLLNGKILKYPEFDLFGYLITQPQKINQPQNFRVAPVKISHAISLTPFNYDTLFNANLGLANRMRKTFGKMDPNPFASEEHFTYYQYTITVDVNEIGKIEVYLKENESIQLKEKDKWEIKEINDEGKGKIVLTKNKEEKEIEVWEGVEFTLERLDNVNILKFALANKSKKDEKAEIESCEWGEAVKERLISFIKALLNLHRSIKGRDEDLSPKLLILGLYENKPYKTYKDKIVLRDEYTEEEYNEILEKEENGKIIRKVIHKVSKSKKPVFEVMGGKFQHISIEDIINKVDNFIKDEKDNNDKEDLYLAYNPEIKVKFDKVEDSNEARNSE